MICILSCLCVAKFIGVCVLDNHLKKIEDDDDALWQNIQLDRMQYVTFSTDKEAMSKSKSGHD